MGLTVTDDALANELTWIRTKTEHLRKESPAWRTNTLSRIAAVVNTLKRLKLISHEMAEDLNNAAQDVDIELTFSEQQ